MLKKGIIFILLCMSTTLLYAQHTTKLHTIKTDFIGIGYSFEMPFSTTSTLNMEVNLAGSFFGGMFLQDSSAIIPTIRMEPRFYYNLKGRFRRGKNVIHNSGDYFSFSAEYIPGYNLTSETNFESVVIFIPKWGFRRALGEKFYFEFAGGVGKYVNASNKWKTTYDIDIRLAYVIY